jgi:hypothetical protein
MVFNVKGTTHTTIQIDGNIYSNVDQNNNTAWFIWYTLHLLHMNHTWYYDNFTWLKRVVAKGQISFWIGSYASTNGRYLWVIWFLCVPWDYANVHKVVLKLQQPNKSSYQGKSIKFDAIIQTRSAERCLKNITWCYLTTNRIRLL